MNRKTRQIGFFTALLGLVAVSFSFPRSATAQILDRILNPVEDILNGGSQQRNSATDYQAQVRQEFDRDYQCVTTEQYSKARYEGFPAGYFTGTVVKQLALRLTPCMLKNGITFNLADLLLSVGFTTRNVNDAVVVVVYAGRKSQTASKPGSGSGSGKNRPGLPSPVPAVDGTFQIFKSNLPSCKPGNYRVAGSFDSSFTTFTLTQAGGAEGCFSSVPAQVFTVPGLTDGGPPVKFESRIGPGGSRIAGTVSRVYGSFTSPIAYPESQGTDGILVLNSQNTKVTGQGISSLPGNPNEPAVQKLPDLPPPEEPIPAQEITTDERGVPIVRTVLHVELDKKATVEQVNAALAAVGGTIAFSQPKIPGITIHIPNTGAIDGVERAQGILSVQPAVAFTAEKHLDATPSPSLGLVDSEFVPSNRSVRDLIPIPLFLIGAVDRNGKEPKPINPNNPVSLILKDYFDRAPHFDLNLKVKGAAEPGNNHGYSVAGMMAARKGNLGLLGLYPAKYQPIIGLGISKTKYYWDDERTWRELSATPGNIVFNLSLGSAKKLEEQYIQRWGAAWVEGIRNRGLENRVAIAVAAGNEGPTTHAKDYSSTAAAGLMDFTNIDEFEEESCETTWIIFTTCVTHSGVRTKEIKKLNNTLVVGALNAHTGNYTEESTRGGNVNAIVEVDVPKRRLAYFTNGDKFCRENDLEKKGFPALARDSKFICYDDGMTSMAAPQVSGLAAYLWNQYPGLKAPEVVQHIIQNQTSAWLLDANGLPAMLPDGDPALSTAMEAKRKSFSGGLVKFVPVVAINVRKTLEPPKPSLTGDQPPALANRPPVANNDTATVPPYGSVNINVLANDTDPDGDSLTVTNVTQGSKGSVASGRINGVITYSSGPGVFNTTDTFTYTISDGKGETATATVTITIR